MALISGRNATIGIESDTTPGNYANIGQVKDFDFSGFAVAMHQLSSRDNDFVRKYPGSIDPGQINLTIDFDATATTHSYTSGLLQYQTNKTKKNIQITMDDSSTTQWTLPCYVMEFNLNEPEEDGQTADLTLAVADSPTLA